jgi:ribosomal protein S14
MNVPKSNSCQECGSPAIFLRPIYIVEKGVFWLCDKCYPR